jgi:peptidyl-prolyl cis-trans isomerase C
VVSDSRSAGGAAGFSYTRLVVALERFERPLVGLSQDQLEEVEELARRKWRLDEQILRTPEARSHLVEERRIDEAVATLAARYDSHHEFMADLARNGVAPAELQAALGRQIAIDDLIETIEARVEGASATEAELFYRLHNERFQRPEKRTARHILITINDSFAENRSGVVRERMASLVARIVKSRQPVKEFARLAQRHSECPTALKGGLLGRVGRGMLYPQLDAALFRLGEREVSGVVESEVGLHLICCEAIHPAGAIPFVEVAGEIRNRLTIRSRKAARYAWLRSLAGEVAARTEIVDGERL